MKPQDKQDEFIRNLVRKNGIEKAPDHFTDSVMEKIKATPLIDDSPLLSKGSWIAIILGTAAMIVVMFTVKIPFIDNLFSSTGIQQVSMNIFSKGFITTMTSFFKGLHLSSVTWMIIAAATGLVIIERILHRRFSETWMLVI